MVSLHAPVVVAESVAVELPPPREGIDDPPGFPAHAQTRHGNRGAIVPAQPRRVEPERVPGGRGEPRPAFPHPQQARWKNREILHFREDVHVLHVRVLRKIRRLDQPDQLVDIRQGNRLTLGRSQAGHHPLLIDPAAGGQDRVVGGRFSLEPAQLQDPVVVLPRDRRRIRIGRGQRGDVVHDVLPRRGPRMCDVCDAEGFQHGAEQGATVDQFRSRIPEPDPALERRPLSGMIEAVGQPLEPRLDEQRGFDQVRQRPLPQKRFIPREPVLAPEVQSDLGHRRVIAALAR